MVIYDKLTSYFSTEYHMYYDQTLKELRHGLTVTWNTKVNEIYKFEKAFNN